MCAELDYTRPDENNSGYLINMVVAFVLQNVVITGADATFLEA